MQLPPARGLPAPASPQVDHTRRKLNWGQLGTVTQNLSHNRTKAHTPQKPPPPSSLPSASEAQREDPVPTDSSPSPARTPGREQGLPSNRTSRWEQGTATICGRLSSHPPQGGCHGREMERKEQRDSQRHPEAAAGASPQMAPRGGGLCAGPVGAAWPAAGGGRGLRGS